jgi:hypothetical protein
LWLPFSLITKNRDKLPNEIKLAIIPKTEGAEEYATSSTSSLTPIESGAGTYVNIKEYAKGNKGDGKIVSSKLLCKANCLGQFGKYLQQNTLG